MELGELPGVPVVDVVDFLEVGDGVFSVVERRERLGQEVFDGEPLEPDPEEVDDGAATRAK